MFPPGAMDGSGYLAQQVNSSIQLLHGLFDDIGVPSHDREAREAEVSRPRRCRAAPRRADAATAL